MTKTKKHAFISLIISLLLISSLVSVSALAADRIAFLQFKIDSSSISLTKSSFADGKLKSPRQTTSGKEIYFEVVSKESKLLSSGNIDNPLVRKLEYENPDKPGELLNKIINLDSAEFTIRVNYDNQIEKINFYRTQYDENLKSVRNDENLIGSVSLSSLSGGENE